MIKYQVHFDYQVFKWNIGWVDKHEIRYVKARSESEAIRLLRNAIPDSSGHWVNRLANEAVSHEEALVIEERDVARELQVMAGFWV
jgi:hypothetical protein